MAGTAVVCIEGVLCKGKPPNGPPVWEGLKLYHALASQFKVVLDSTHDDFTDIEHWCKVNGLNRHVLVLARDDPNASDDMVRDTHLCEWRSQGFGVELYVTASPYTAKLMMGAGVITLLLAHPAFARPEFRPDHDRGMKPWAAIEAEVTEAAERRDTTVRIDAEMQP